ncbi:hypothetical protein BN1012_Phect1292 [Candidatus Phaeomarinobacter ectocarpi]|uniref:Lipoprotein n=1 Tax=Candidatus Phaeomarinibacter ectocarpi TaxID=1458461 RepID=X5MMT1_9HYPH|nr:hypothetical protein [Candidatus Phaeomarinobacter ectocarpi]CDO59506.1 hypothetical protein BN1012_Phect1292 [Candidatus Phaeomarinobacter ectocarpi]
MTRILLAAALALTVSACATAEDRAARAQAQLAADKAECQTLGFTPDTEAFSNCLLKLREIRAEEAAAIEQRRANNRAIWGPDWPWYYNRGYRHRRW